MKIPKFDELIHKVKPLREYTFRDYLSDFDDESAASSYSGQMVQQIVDDVMAQEAKAYADDAKEKLVNNERIAYYVTIRTNEMRTFLLCQHDRCKGGTFCRDASRRLFETLGIPSNVADGLQTKLIREGMVKIGAKLPTFAWERVWSDDTLSKQSSGLIITYEAVAAQSSEIGTNAPRPTNQTVTLRLYDTNDGVHEFPLQPMTEPQTVTFQATKAVCIKGGDIVSRSKNGETVVPLQFEDVPPLNNGDSLNFTVTLKVT